MKELINKLLNVMKEKFVEVSSHNNENKKSLVNHEYKINIGTLYKGSEKESNKLLRFKERFRIMLQLAFSYLKESMGR